MSELQTPKRVPSVGTPKRVPVRVRVSYSFTVTVRVEFGHSEPVLEFRHSELKNTNYQRLVLFSIRMDGNQVS